MRIVKDGEKGGEGIDKLSEITGVLKVLGMEPPLTEVLKLIQLFEKTFRSKKLASPAALAKSVGVPLCDFIVKYYKPTKKKSSKKRA